MLGLDLVTLAFSNMYARVMKMGGQSIIRTEQVNYVLSYFRYQPIHNGRILPASSVTKQNSRVVTAVGNCGGLESANASTIGVVSFLRNRSTYRSEIRDYIATRCFGSSRTSKCKSCCIRKFSTAAESVGSLHRSFSKESQAGLRSETRRKNMATVLKFTSSLEKADPLKTPVTIIGQLDDLRKLPYDDIKIKLEPRVPVDVYHYAIESLQPSPTDCCSLFMNHSTIVSLPLKISRNNTNSRAHYLTKAVKNASNNMDEYIVILCEKSDVFASACAVARAFPTYIRKSKKEGRDEPGTTTVEFMLVTRNGSNVEIGKERLSNDELATLHIAAEAIRNAARITDTPCSEMHTNQFIREAAIIAEKLGVQMTVIQGEALAERGMGGIYNVGKAAENAPAMVVLSHVVPGAAKTIAWVGKGIVYDTGGLSMKDKVHMCTMKRDCGGAAGILNAFYVAVKEGFSNNLHAVLCLAENAVGPKSYRPDDILVMYSKKTVEINNTDAEGRLVLADGVVYAKQDLKADIIVDMATLTGAQGVSTGHYHAACLTNVEEWEALSVKAGKCSGDLVYPIVFAPEFHFSEFNSVIADMKNSAADRSNALCSCAGLFIFSHLGFDFSGTWVHIDMASPVESGGRATGYGVALLNVLFGKYSNSTLLKSLGPQLP